MRAVGGELPPDIVWKKITWQLFMLNVLSMTAFDDGLLLYNSDDLIYSLGL